MNTIIPSNIKLLSESFNYKNYIESDKLEWPFDDIKFHHFSTKVLDLFCSEVTNLESFLSESILCDIYFIISLINYSNNNAILKNDLFQNSTWAKKNSENILKSLNLNFNKDKKIFKRLIKNLIYSKKNLKKKFKIFGSKNNFVENYLLQNNHNFDYDYSENFFCIRNDNIKNSDEKISNFINSFFIKYQKLCIEYYEMEFDFNVLKSLWFKRINEIKYYKKNFNRNFNLETENVYFSNNENQYHRILASTLKQKMIKTFSFDHGYDSYIKKKSTNYWFKNIYDFHVSYNLSSKNFLEKDINLNSPYPKKLIPDFLTYKNDIFISKKKKFSFKKKVKNIKNVMLIGFPMTSQRYYTEIGCFWYYKLFLEIKILKSLKKANYKVIYKIHPDRIGWESIISDYCDEIRYSRFEDKIEDIDLFIFTYTSNSCLNPAICSNKPIILFDTNLDNFNEMQVDAFNKRCKVLNIKFNKRGYIFDENNLFDAIENINTDINHEYFESFLI